MIDLCQAYRMAVAATALSAISITANAVSVSPVKISPEAGFINEPIERVVLDFSTEYSKIEFSPRALLYYDPSENVDKTGRIFFGGEEVDQAPDMYSAEINGTQIIFTPKITWDKPGKYQLMIPAGALIFTRENGAAFINGNLINPVWKLGIVPNPSVAPEPGNVSDLSVISLELPEGFSFASGYAAVSKFFPTVYRSNEIGEALEYVGRYTRLDNSSDWKGSRSLIYSNPDFTPTNGESYLVTFIQSFVNIKDDAGVMEAAEPTLAMSLLYHYYLTSGTSEVDSSLAAGRLKAYSVEGICRRVSSIADLPKGLWIIDGRKVIIH